MEYDPLLAKLAVWAGSRSEAIDRTLRALGEYDVGGIRTNIGFFKQVLEDPEFRDGNLHTGFIDEFFTRVRQSAPPVDVEGVAAFVAALHVSSKNAGSQGASEPRTGSSQWLEAGRRANLQ